MIIYKTTIGSDINNTDYRKGNTSVFYTNDYFETVEEIDIDIVNFYPAADNIIVKRVSKNGKNLLEVGHYEDDIFYFKNITIDADLDDLSAIILLSNKSNKVFYTMFDNKPYGDIYTTSSDMTIWKLSIPDVINSINNNNFLIDFHKVLSIYLV